MRRVARCDRGARASSRRRRPSPRSPTIDARVDQATSALRRHVRATSSRRRSTASLVDSARIVERRRTVHAARADGREAIGRGRRRPHHRDGDDRLPLRRLPRGAAGAAVALPRARVVAGGEVAVAPRVEVAVGSRVSRRGGQGVRARRSGAQRPARPDVPHLALGRRGAARAPRRRPRSPSARSCSRLRCGGRGPLRVEPAHVDHARARRQAPARVGDARRRRTAGARRAWRSRVVGEPELARTAAGIAWSRPEPGPPDATTLADRVEHAAGGRA